MSHTSLRSLRMLLCAVIYSVVHEQNPSIGKFQVSYNSKTNELKQKFQPLYGESAQVY